MTNYTVGDFVTRIKNAVLARRKKIVFPYGRYVKDVANLLVKQGYLKSVKEEEVDGKKALVVEPVFDKRTAVFTDVKIISKPSLRVYANAVQLGAAQRKSLGNIVVSTNQGLMMGKEAFKKGLGGELLFEIW